MAIFSCSEKMTGDEKNEDLHNSLDPLQSLAGGESSYHVALIYHLKTVLSAQLTSRDNEYEPETKTQINTDNAITYVIEALADKSEHTADLYLTLLKLTEFDHREQGDCTPPSGNFRVPDSVQR
jgi:hypothetical protein